MARKAVRSLALPDDERVFTVHEAAEYLNASESSIYRLAKVGDIPHFRVGSALRFSRIEIDHWKKFGGSVRFGQANYRNPRGLSSHAG